MGTCSSGRGLLHDVTGGKVLCLLQCLQVRSRWFIVVDLQTSLNGTARADCYFHLVFLKVYVESKHSVCLNIQRTWTRVLGSLVELRIGSENGPALFRSDGSVNSMLLLLLFSSGVIQNNYSINIWSTRSWARVLNSISFFLSSQSIARLLFQVHPLFRAGFRGAM